MKGNSRFNEFINRYNLKLSRKFVHILKTRRKKAEKKLKAEKKKRLMKLKTENCKSVAIILIVLSGKVQHVLIQGPGT